MLDFTLNFIFTAFFVWPEPSWIDEKLEFYVILRKRAWTGINGMIGGFFTFILFRFILHCARRWEIMSCMCTVFAPTVSDRWP